MQPIRVAQVVGKMNGGGVESVVMNYYRHIDYSRFQFDFLIDADSKYVPREEIESRGGRIFEVPPYQKARAYQNALVGLFNDQKWPIVHSHLNTLSVFPLRAAKKAGVPVRIAHSHSTAGQGEYAKNLIKYFLRNFSKTYSNHRMACTRHAGEWLFREKDNFDIIYNAIELDKFSFSKKARAEVREELGLSDDQLVIGHIGRFMAQKNHKFIVEMFCEIVKKCPDAVLVLVGNGELRDAIEKDVCARGISDSVFFLGQQEDVARLYSAFDVFVLPSLYEGLGIVGIEALRSGLPCFFSTQVPEEINVTGTGVFLPIDDPPSWAELIRSIERSIDREYVDDRQFSDYEIDGAARHLMDVYEQLVVGKVD